MVDQHHVLCRYWNSFAWCLFCLFNVQGQRLFPKRESDDSCEPGVLHQVVRAQYHPGTKGGTGTWLVEPTLRLEYIGRLGTQGRRLQEGPRDNGTPAHALSAADAIAPADSPMEV